MTAPSVLVGVIVGIGGVFGFVKSLVMGLLSTAVLVYAGLKIPSRFGYQLSIGWWTSSF
jgi:hypothetical protein